MSEMILWPWDGWGETGAPYEPPPMQGDVTREGDVRDDQRSRSDAPVRVNGLRLSEERPKSSVSRA
jgi:hypothetical protein